MGRPLFSTLNVETPAVHVEPEPTQPVCERWTYWNRFDPDSDEFFENAEDERIYVPHGTEPRRVLVTSGRGRASSDAVEREIGEIVAEEMSSSSSEGTSSGRETPVYPFTDEETSIEEVELDHRRRAAERIHMALARRAANVDADADVDVDEVPAPAPEDGHTYRAVQARVAYAGYQLQRASTSFVRTPYHADQLSRSSSPTPILRTEVDIEPVSLTRPAAASTPTRTAPIAIPARPSTPPNQTSYSYGTPSPAPSVTPRLYTWRAPTLPAASSPSPNMGSPLPNRGARMSRAHISPSAVTVQRVLG